MKVKDFPAVYRDRGGVEPHGYTSVSSTEPVVTHFFSTTSTFAEKCLIQLAKKDLEGSPTAKLVVDIWVGERDFVSSKTWTLDPVQDVTISVANLISSLKPQADEYLFFRMWVSVNQGKAGIKFRTPVMLYSE